MRLSDSDRVEPRASGQPEVRATTRDLVERRHGGSDLDRLHRVRIEARGPDGHPSRGLGDLQQGDKRRLVAEVMERADHIEAEILSETPEPRVIAARQVAAEP